MAEMPTPEHPIKVLTGMSNLMVRPLAITAEHLSRASLTLDLAGPDWQVLPKRCFGQPKTNAPREKKNPRNRRLSE